LRALVILTVLGMVISALGVATFAVSMEGISAASSSDPFTSSWSLALPSDAAVASDSSTLVANLVTQYEDNYGTVGLDAGNFDGYPIVTVPADQPDVPISVSSGCNNFTVDTGTSVPIPPTAVPGTSSDHPLIIWQPSTNTEWEFWLATDTDGSWSACWGGELTNVSSSNGVFPAPYGVSASGISYLGTMITEADIESGSIDHMIAIQVVGGDCNGFVAPADRTDCGSAPGQVSEGTELRFPPGLAMPSGLTPFAQMVFRAIQNYGMIVTDQSGAVDIVGETSADWTGGGTDPITASWNGQPAYAALDGVPWSQLQVLAP
jgi:hypothetical protein